MAQPSIQRTVRIHYRRAILEGGDGPTLQKRLEAVVKGTLGADARKRVFPISTDSQHKACLNYSEIGSESFIADIMHLDGRSALPTWLHPDKPKPVAEIIPKELDEGEASLSEPLYILVRNNHVAAIERMGFRTVSLTRYINTLLKAAGQLADGTEWKLAPKIGIEGSLGGAAQKVIFKPSAEMLGEGPSMAPPRKTPSRKAQAAAPGEMITPLDAIVATGRRVIDMIVAAGGDETKIEALRSRLSNDLALRARLEISIASVRHKTRAEIDPRTVEQAFAELSSEGDVTIVSSDGKSNGKLVQLVYTAEVLETGGLIDWQRATYALVAAINAWAANGSIDPSE